MATRSLARKAPRMGEKKVFLPNFTLTLLRTPKQPPNFATFIVPLNLNKLDLRDYLWNAYGVPVRGVRSFIQQQKLRQDKPNAKRAAPRRWFRPRAIKKMMVEMDDPFVWPDEPTDFTAWEKETKDALDEDQKKKQDQAAPDYREKPSHERKSIAEQAKDILAGKDVWSTEATKPTWEDDGEEVEVEKDVKI